MKIINNILNYFGLIKSTIIDTFEIGDTVYLKSDDKKESYIVERKDGIRYSGILQNSCMCWVVKSQWGSLWHFREDLLTKNK